MRTHHLILLVALAATAPAVAHAQPDPSPHSAGDIAQARELFNQAIDQRDKGDPRGALEKFKAAHALAGTPVTGVELGRTYMLVGMLVEARETFLSIARIPVTPEETARSSAARGDATTLAEQVRARIPSLTVRINGVSADSVSVTIDGATVPTAALVAPRLVDPGPHDLVATSTTGGRAETRVDLKEGESREVQLNIAFGPAQTSAADQTPAQPLPVTTGPATSDAQVSSVSAPPGRGRRTLGLVVGGAGVIAAGIGALFGVEALSKNSDSNASGNCTGNICNAAGYSLRHDAITDGTLSTVLVGVGAAALIGGGLLWLTAPSGAPSSSASAGRLELSVGPSGFVVKGVF